MAGANRPCRTRRPSCRMRMDTTPQSSIRLTKELPSPAITSNGRRSIGARALPQAALPKALPCPAAAGVNRCSKVSLERNRGAALPSLAASLTASLTVSLAASLTACCLMPCTPCTPNPRRHRLPPDQCPALQHSVHSVHSAAARLIALQCPLPVPCDDNLPQAGQAPSGRSGPKRFPAAAYAALYAGAVWPNCVAPRCPPRRGGVSPAQPRPSRTGPPLAPRGVVSRKQKTAGPAAWPCRPSPTLLPPSTTTARAPRCTAAVRGHRRRQSCDPIRRRRVVPRTATPPGPPARPRCNDAP